MQPYLLGRRSSNADRGRNRICALLVSGTDGNNLAATERSRASAGDMVIHGADSSTATSRFESHIQPNVTPQAGGGKLGSNRGLEREVSDRSGCASRKDALTGTIHPALLPSSSHPTLSPIDT